MPYLSEDRSRGARKQKGFQYIESSPFDDGSDPAREVGQSNWVFSYADMMTSMVVFLLMLLALSDVSYSKLKQVSKETKGAMGVDGTALSEELKTPIEKFQTDFQEIVEKENLSEDLKLEVIAEDATLIIGESVIFESGHARLSNGTEEKLKSLFGSLKKLPSDYHFTIEGHTDDNPIQTIEYASNWELSAARSLAVLIMMKAMGFEENRLSFQAFGSHQPLVPNRDKAGNSIPENQRHNRRAVIKIHQK